MSTSPNECGYCGMEHGSGEPCSALGDTVRKPEPRHPLTDEPTNEARAARLDAFIQMYADTFYDGGFERETVTTIVQDFITDALHWAAQHETPDDPGSPAEIAHAALHMVEEEISMEKKKEPQ